jgi:hypothetical protein
MAINGFEALPARSRRRARCVMASHAGPPVVECDARGGTRPRPADRSWWSAWWWASDRISGCGRPLVWGEDRRSDDRPERRRGDGPGQRPPTQTNSGSAADLSTSSAIAASSAKPGETAGPRRDAGEQVTSPTLSRNTPRGSSTHGPPDRCRSAPGAAHTSRSCVRPSKPGRRRSTRSSGSPRPLKAGAVGGASKVGPQ